MNLEREDIDDILKILDSTPYDALNLSTDRFSLQMRRSESGMWQGEQSISKEPLIDELPGSVQDESGAGSVAAIDQAAADGLIAVIAPLPGTFYRAPRPGADPFVEVGDEVTPQTVVCIVETMKLMNSVQSGCAGRVTKILVENGAMVEKGGVMVLIEPASP